MSKTYGVTLMDTSRNAEPRYFVDIDWLKENNRSLSALVRPHLCSSCREKKISDKNLVKRINQCCADKDGFVDPKLPLMEMTFRLFLSNGNKPLNLNQIQEQLKEWTVNAGILRDVSPEALRRLIGVDQYYGLRPYER